MLWQGGVFSAPSAVLARISITAFCTIIGARTQAVLPKFNVNVHALIFVLYAPLFAIAVESLPSKVAETKLSSWVLLMFGLIAGGLGQVALAQRRQPPVDDRGHFESTSARWCDSGLH